MHCWTSAHELFDVRSFARGIVQWRDAKPAASLESLMMRWIGLSTSHSIIDGCSLPRSIPLLHRQPAGRFPFTHKATGIADRSSPFSEAAMRPDGERERDSRSSEQRSTAPSGLSRSSPSGDGQRASSCDAWGTIFAVVVIAFTGLPALGSLSSSSTTSEGVMVVVDLRLDTTQWPPQYTKELISDRRSVSGEEAGLRSDSVPSRKRPSRG